MAAHKSAINLLPKSEFDTSIWGRILKWSLTTGRYIIILTEMVVIVAFLSRFKFDKDLADLNERIEGKKHILDATYSTEINFRATQARLLEAKVYIDHQKDTSALLDHITNKIPQGLVLTGLQANWSNRSLDLTGKADSQQAIAELMYRIRQDSVWKTSDLLDVSSGVDNFIIFTAHAEF
jgi:hypothetical protein